MSLWHNAQKDFEAGADMMRFDAFRCVSMRLMELVV